MSRRLLLAALVAALCGSPVALRAEKPVSATCSAYPVEMPYATDTPRNSDLQVAVEVRFITMNDECVERLGLDLDSDKPLFLDNTQVADLLAAAQKDVKTNIMQAPRLMTLDGQKGVLTIGEAQSFVTGFNVSQGDMGTLYCPVTTTIETGTRVAIKPVVSADRRFVRLDLEAELSNLANPVPRLPVVVPFWPNDGQARGQEPIMTTQMIQLPVKNVQLAASTQTTIPDGGTVLLAGQKVRREVREEHRTPLLSRVPYVSRLFKNVGYSTVTESTLLLVTPRIVISEEARLEPPARSLSACPCLPASAAVTVGVATKCLTTPVVVPDGGTVVLSGLGPVACPVGTSSAPVAEAPVTKCSATTVAVPDSGTIISRGVNDKGMSWISVSWDDSPCVPLVPSCTAIRLGAGVGAAVAVEAATKCSPTPMEKVPACDPVERPCSSSPNPD